MKKTLILASIIVSAIALTVFFEPKNKTTTETIDGVILESPKAGITEEINSVITESKEKKAKLKKVKKKKNKEKASRFKEPTLDELFEEMGEKYDLEPELLKAVATIESNLTPSAVSSDGKSQGLMQIQPRWWNDAINYLGIYDMYNARQNIELGAYILDYLRELYGSEYRALEAYNTGNPDSTNGYADRVLEVKEGLKNAKSKK